MNWESRSPRNLFGWQKPHRKANLAIIRSWPELKLGKVDPLIMVLNGGCRWDWCIVAERKP